MSLIDKEETIKDLREYADRKLRNSHIDTANGILSAASRIEQNSNAVDAVEVVRCCGCEKWDPFEERYGYCYKWHENTTDEDFCSYADRKEDKRE